MSESDIFWHPSGRMGWIGRGANREFFRYPAAIGIPFPPGLEPVTDEEFRIFIKDCLEGGYGFHSDPEK